ncbi:MAG: hypothetical protein U0T56_08540 [Ferruginibacter sp.]
MVRASENIKSVIVPSITGRYIRDADIIISNRWQMTYAVSELPASKGKIQPDTGLRNLGRTAGQGGCQLLFAGTLIAIARYLQDLVEENRRLQAHGYPQRDRWKKNSTPTIPLAQETGNDHHALLGRTPQRHFVWLEALKQVHALYPELRVQFFGAYSHRQVCRTGSVTYSVPVT